MYVSTGQMKNTTMLCAILAQRILCIEMPCKPFSQNNFFPSELFWQKLPPPNKHYVILEKEKTGVDVLHSREVSVYDKLVIIDLSRG